MIDQNSCRTLTGSGAFLQDQDVAWATQCPKAVSCIAGRKCLFKAKNTKGRNDDRKPCDHQQQFEHFARHISMMPSTQRKNRDGFAYLSTPTVKVMYGHAGDPRCTLLERRFLQASFGRSETAHCRSGCRSEIPDAVDVISADAGIFVHPSHLSGVTCVLSALRNGRLSP